MVKCARGVITMNANRILKPLILTLSSIFLAVSVLAFLYGKFFPNAGDPYIGNYDIYSLDTDWAMTIEGEDGAPVMVDMGISRNDLIGKTLILKHSLPETIENNMVVAFRSSMNDIYIYVDGSIRSVYTTKNYSDRDFDLPSAYVFCDVSNEDAGKEVSMKMYMKTTGNLNPVIYGYSGNIFYALHESAQPIIFTGSTLMIIGFLVIIAYLFLKMRSKAPGYLLHIGELSLTMGLWMLSESRLRQWFFASQLPSRLYSYITIELLGVFACLFFDSVQEKRYHKVYTICEVVLLCQLTANIILAYTGIVSLYTTLVISHIESGITAAIVIVLVLRDIIKKQTGHYRAIIIGIILFLISAAGEMISFYVNRMAALGLFLSVGVILLVFCTVIQMIINEMRRSADRIKDQERFTLNTLEAFADSIDTRDEYTGGHSYRVAEYASRLARALSHRYHLTENDITEIHYIGLMHDIGKIAIPESILNCSGKISDEEFTIVKQHVIIGEQLLISMQHSQTLLDGIRFHHERYDGSGYPDGLKENEIPLVARILAIADSYDAMTSERVFREPMTGAMAKAEILACAGSQFDPEIAHVFCNLIDRKIIYPIKYSGLERSNKGVPLQSSMLEFLLRKDTLSGIEHTICEPSHVRVGCFIAKAAERNNSKVDIYLVGFSDTDVNEDNAFDLGKRLVKIKETLRESATLHDLILDYTPEKLLLIYIDRKDSDIADMLAAITDPTIPEELLIKRLSPALVEGTI